MKPIDRAAAYVTVVLVLAVIFFGRSAFASLDTDDQLIDRGQEITNCIGDRQDLIDDWRAIATAQFLIQADRLEQGLEVRVATGLRAERNIRLLVADKREIRDTSRDLIAEDETEFTCPTPDASLIPPPIT